MTTKQRNSLWTNDIDIDTQTLSLSNSDFLLQGEGEIVAKSPGFAPAFFSTPDFPLRLWEIVSVIALHDMQWSLAQSFLKDDIEK